MSSNLNENKQVYLLVPGNRLSLAITKAKKYGIADNIVVKSIESFVAQNIDEIAQFSKDELKKQREALLRVYNRRVRDANERHAPLLMLKDGVLLDLAKEEASGQENIQIQTTNATFIYPTDSSINMDNSLNSDE